MFWTDDYTFYAKDDASINAIISSLEDYFFLEREEHMTRFIGLEVNRSEDKFMIALI